MVLSFFYSDVIPKEAIQCSGTFAIQSTSSQPLASRSEDAPVWSYQGVIVFLR